MDGLDDFEKQLAAEKAERERAEERAERREKKHRHRHHHRRSRSPDRRDRDRDDRDDRERAKDRDGHRSRHHRSREHDSDDGHRHKRSRHSKRDDDGDSGRHRHRHRDREPAGNEEPDFIASTDAKEKLPIPDEELPRDEATPLERDSWMTGAIDIDYIHRGKKEKTPPPKQVPERVIHHRELNTGLGDGSNASANSRDETTSEVDYTFGDEGSSWRMTKLNAVYRVAEQTGRLVDEVGEERFGNLKEFDDAREEKTEMDRRKVYGEGYKGAEKPTGGLYRERMARTRPPPQEEAIGPDDEPEQGIVMEDAVPPVDQTTLNRMRAQVMKAKLRKAPDAAKLEEEYNAALARFNGTASGDKAVVLDATHSRMLAGTRNEVKAIDNKRGRERGTVEANEDMSIDDMVREERRTRGQAGGEGVRLAERIAKDAKFDDDLEYLDENAEKLAKRVHKSEINLKNMAVSEYQKMNKVLETCPLCHHEDRQPPQDLPIAPILALGTRVYLTLATEPELKGAEGGAVVVPISHRTNLLECDDDEWEEMRNFMKSLTRLYHEQGREVLFYENAAAPHRRLHAALVAVPIPWDLGDTAPAFFREAVLSTEEEWSQHKKLIDTGKKAREGAGKLAFRRSIAKEMPYFHVWFTIDGGLGHIVEDSSRWPKGDLFAREIIGGMLDCEPDNIKKQGRWSRGDPRADGFKKRWRKFDWTRALTEGQ
ncbi:cell cycle control protein cwf19 [Diaporthe amygdali]|uniref:cell cycle control protein cwf19 n=1 Tax=Phomopsis amygdali TaxID=1214568 RepID=UPI0022FEBC2D|nr:cell cycle control protein cwf19 [Diaporthe amygdali]KAJ0118760.1 cell cycle control protein cwf19 [Diaporthe amygdali]